MGVTIMIHKHETPMLLSIYEHVSTVLRAKIVNPSVYNQCCSQTVLSWTSFPTLTSHSRQLICPNNKKTATTTEVVDVSRQQDLYQ